VYKTYHTATSLPAASRLFCPEEVNFSITVALINYFVKMLNYLTVSTNDKVLLLPALNLFIG
jgi:hypothetical protein